jgi:hypothetical protein
MAKKEIKTPDLFKSAFIWQKTSQKPQLEYNPENKNVYCVFEDTEQFRNALNDYLTQGISPNIKEYVGLFKSLRIEMYYLKNQYEKVQG